MDIFGLFTPRTATLRSRLDAQACAANLAAAMDSDLAMFGQMPVLGSVHAGGATMRKRIRYRNSFQTILVAAFEPLGTTTQIRCRSRMHIITLVVLGFWALGFISIAGSFIADAVSGRVEGGAIWILMPIVFLAFAILIIWLGRWFARGEFDFLVDHVAKAAEAEVLDRSPM
jgi:hypothetical protein